MKKIQTQELKEFLDLKVEEYKTEDFIQEDPISIPKQFSKRQDIEIAGFLSATIAWGNRKSIIKSANAMMNLMDNAPFDFVRQAKSSDMKEWSGSIHRTFMAEDLKYFIQNLQRLYREYDSMEDLFMPKEDENTILPAIVRFRAAFLDKAHRAHKHVSNPDKNSSAKRLNMFLRWMVRKDQVDFGIWESIPTSKLCLPLDVHTGKVGRKIGLLERKQNDRKAVEEITENLKQLNPEDPTIYDFALFGLGLNEKW